MITDPNKHDLLLYRYFERTEDPFLSMTELPVGKARQMLIAKREGGHFNHPDMEGFLAKRYGRDQALHKLFVEHGGEPERTSPVYFFLGEHRQWMSAYFEAAVIRIPLEELNSKTVSFTYGDSFAVLNPKLYGKEEYWGRIYFADEILPVIQRNGYPPYVEYDFKLGIYPAEKNLNDHLKYIEAQVWSNKVIDKYRAGL